MAFEDFHKVRQLKYARVKYNNRHGQQARNTISPSKSPTEKSPTLNNGLIMKLMGDSRLQNNDTE